MRGRREHREDHAGGRRGLWALAACCALLAGLGAAPAAHALRVPAQPIPEGQTNASGFIGSPATPHPDFAPGVPRHPFMAPNERSNLHNDAYASGTYFRHPGPLGRNMQRRSTLQFADCASHAFDSRDRVASICVGLEGPRLMLFDPKTLDTLASFPLPPRDPTSGDPFSGFSGGGYFYLDHRDRVITPTTNRQVWVIGERESPSGPSFALERVYDLQSTVPLGDQIVSALPDFAGRIWFVTADGIVGTIAPGSGAVRSRRLVGEEIGNSFSVDEDGGVYIVSDAALYRFDATASGAPGITWREVYDNVGVEKPSKVTAGSGTTPDIMGRDLVAIVDNDDPEKVTVYRRAKRVSGSRLLCSEPVFDEGRSATENSLISTHRSLIAENNYGYTGPLATQNGRSTAPGVTRVDVDRRNRRCRTVWESSQRSPTVVPKLSLRTGLVYLYTKPPQANGDDTWYLTALDFRTGRRVYSRLAGEGIGYNNNYAPLSLGPEGSAYIGTLGGLVRLFDTGAGAGPGDGPGDRPGARPAPAECAGQRATLVGTSGADRLEGTAGRDVISTGAGDDRVRGGGGPDLICGGSGHDTLAGERGEDTLRGESGNDRLDGGEGRDRCAGGSGRDSTSRCEG